MDMHSWSSWDQQAVETLVMLKGTKEQSAFNAAQASLAAVTTKTRRTRSRASSPWYEVSASHRDSSSPSEEGADYHNDHDHTTSRLRHQRSSSSQRAARAAGRAQHDALQTPASVVAHKLLKKHTHSPADSATLLTTLPLLSAFFAPATPSTSAPSRAASAAFSAPASPMHASPAASGDHTSATSSRLATEATAETGAPAAGLKRPSSPLCNETSDIAAVVRARKVPRTSLLSAIASAAAGAHAGHASSTVALPAKPVLPQRRPLPLVRNFGAVATHSRLSHAVSVNAAGMAHLQPVHLLATFPVQRMGALHVGEAPA